MHIHVPLAPQPIILNNSGQINLTKMDEMMKTCLKQITKLATTIFLTRKMYLQFNK